MAIVGGCLFLSPAQFPWPHAGGREGTHDSAEGIKLAHTAYSAPSQEVLLVAVLAANVGSMLRDTAIPAMVFEPSILGAMSMTGGIWGRDFRDATSRRLFMLAGRNTPTKFNDNAWLLFDVAVNGLTGSLPNANERTCGGQCPPGEVFMPTLNACVPELIIE